MPGDAGRYRLATTGAPGTAAEPGTLGVRPKGGGGGGDPAAGKLVSSSSSIAAKISAFNSLKGKIMIMNTFEHWKKHLE